MKAHSTKQPWHPLILSILWAPKKKKKKKKLFFPFFFFFFFSLMPGGRPSCPNPDTELDALSSGRPMVVLLDFQSVGVYIQSRLGGPDLVVVD